MLSGPQGGDAQIAGRVAEGKTKMVLFFKDPLSSHPHEADVNMLIRVCDVHNIPLATNAATASKVVARDTNGSFAGNVISAQNFDSLSDRTLKTDIEPIGNALHTVAQLQGVEFNWLNSGERSAGVIAQELETVLPYLVNTSSEGVKSVNYTGIIAYLIESVKSLSARVEELEKKQD